MAKEKVPTADTGLGVADFAAPAAELITTFSNQDSTFAAKGGAIGGGIGAGLGAAVGGPAGAAIGKLLGSAAGQMIGGVKDKRLSTERMSANMARKYSQLNLAYNAEPYGSGSTFYAEEGLILPGVGNSVPVNIEKGELLVDPSKMEVLQSFDTKRYKRHAKDKSQEHPGNFIKMDASHVIIPKDKANAFKNGDKISRRSIIAQIMQNQDDNGIETNDESIYAQDGLAGTSAYRKGMQKPVAGKPAPGKAITKKSNTKLSAKLPLELKSPEARKLMNFGKFPKAKHPFFNPEFDPAGALVAAGQSIADNNVDGVGLPNDLQQFEIMSGMGDVNNGSKFGTGPKNSNPPFTPIEINSVKAARAANLLPTAFGIAMAGQNDPFLQYDENGQFDAAKSMIAQMPVDENIEAARAGVAQNTAGFIKAMRNVNSPSTRAEVADVVLKTNAQIGAIEQDAQNRRVQRIAQKLGMLADIEQKQGADRLMARNKFALESSQDRAARQNMIHSAISEGATNFSKSVMDDERIKLGNSILRYNKINPGGADVLPENTEAVNMQIANIAGLLPGVMATGYQVPYVPGVSNGVPIVNGQAVGRGVGGVRNRVGAPANAKRLLGGNIVK